jgi:hypothetical protein
MFNDYIYVSGTSNTLRQHFDELAEEIGKKFHLNNHSVVVDIGSNDGTLLKSFQRVGTKTLGFEPAVNIAKLAKTSGVSTINQFFGKSVAEEVSKNLSANVILATNVFAHVNDLDDFVEGVLALLDDKGIFVIEVPYVVNMVEKMLFDSIYHEHLSYFSLGPLITLFTRFGMKVLDVKRIDTHGGSIRVFVAKSSSDFPPGPSVDNMLKIEEQAGIGSFRTFEEFGARVGLVKTRLTAILKAFKRSGKRIAGYGAPAKGNTLLNYCAIGTDLIEYLVDESPLKQGLFTPGTHIPILPTGVIRTDRPDYALLLAWNYAREIFEKEALYRKNGGRFILPMPDPQVQ